MKKLLTLLSVIILSQASNATSLLEKQWLNVVAKDSYSMASPAIVLPPCRPPMGPLPPCPPEECICGACLAICEANYIIACEAVRNTAELAGRLCLATGGLPTECQKQAEQHFWTNIAGPASDYYECLAQLVHCEPCK